MRTLAATACLFLLGACAVSYTPKPDRPFEEIAEFKSTNRVTLRNAQPATEEVRMTKWYVNPHAWTDVAIAIARRELEARGMTVADGEQRVIDMSFESVSSETGWVKISSEVVMNVKTGDGYSQTYRGLNSSAMMANLERQVDGAMMRVVVEMLRDPRIVAYLTK